MNVWVVYFPCSGGGLVEPVIRFASKLDVSEPAVITDDNSIAPYLKVFVPANGSLSTRGTPREFPYYSLSDMIKNQYHVGPTNTTVFSIICPTADAAPQEIFDWVDGTSLYGDSVMYVGYTDPIFCIVAQQKNNAEVIHEIFKPNVRIKEWNEEANSFDDLDRWQQREYLSMHLDFFFAQVAEQNLLASEKEWKTFYAEDFYRDTRGTMRKVFEYLNADADIEKFENLCSYWERNQAPVHHDYQCIQDAIDAIENGNLDFKFRLRSVVYEAIIQRYLKVKKNISLKCYGLNTFPSTVKELQEYYE